MPPPATARDEPKSAARGALRDRLPALVRFLFAALVVGSGAVSLASEPGPAAGGDGPGSETRLASWLFVFVALCALYSFESRYRAKTGVARHGTATRNGSPQAVPPERQADARAEHAVEPARRLIGLLPKKRSVTAGERPRPPAVPAPELNLPEDSPLLRRPSGRGVKEWEEESFRVAEPEAPASPAAPAPGIRAGTTAAAAPAPAPSRSERCAALRAEGRMEEAARIAREGLAGDDDPGPLLIELSRAELGLGRVDAAIETARDAHFACPSRESISNLIRLLAETRRFARSDGPTLRRAAARHPEQPLLRHAAGVFESMYGEPGAAERELRAALRLEPDAEQRAAIERDLARARGRLTG